MFDLVKTANAQSASKIMSNPTVSGLIAKISANIINPIIGVVFFGAFVVFTYGIVKMIANEEGSEERTNGKNSIIWGVIGMFIMLSAFGIIRLISNTLEVPDPFL